MKNLYITLKPKYLPYNPKDKWAVYLKTTSKLIDIEVGSFDTKPEADKCLKLIQQSSCKTLGDIKKLIKEEM